MAVAIGVLIYCGGVRLNLSRFFRVTGFVLVLVAAGLVATTIHTAHEAGWLNAGQGQALDLTWLVVPGSWTSALLTGMLGWQPLPTYAELIGYVVYLVPAAIYVLWPRRRQSPRPGADGSGSAVLVLLLVLVARRLRWRGGGDDEAPRAPRPSSSSSPTPAARPRSSSSTPGRTDVQGHQRRHGPR